MSMNDREYLWLARMSPCDPPRGQGARASRPHGAYRRLHHECVGREDAQRKSEDAETRHVCCGDCEAKQITISTVD
jgi:hypothetical protein